MSFFVERPRRQRGRSYAAQYVLGEPLDGLRQVVEKTFAEGADVVEVPRFKVALVRYLNVPDHHPAYMDYKVVPAGHYLVYSQLYHLLYVSDAEAFVRDHEEPE